MSEYSKLVQRLDTTGVGKVIHWELCKKFKFDHTNKWYMHNPESVVENEMHKILWDFDMQMDPLISTRQPETEIVDKKQSVKLLNFPL